MAVHPHLGPGPAGGPVSRLGLSLFLGVALSVTALPVLGRILAELGITRTKVGATALAAAAAGDAVGWVLLAAVAKVAQAGAAGFDPLDAARTAGLTAGFAAFVRVAVRPALGWCLRRTTADGDLGPNALAVLLVAVLLASAATAAIGVFALLGAFLVGAAAAAEPGVRDAVTARLTDFVGGFFLPIFFTHTGLRTDVGALGGPTGGLIGAAVLAAAVVGKVGGCGAAARLAGFGWREAWAVGALMNARGLMELVVVNVGYDLGVIPRELYGLLVLMAVGTTMMTAPLVRAVCRGTELEKEMGLAAR